MQDELNRLCDELRVLIRNPYAQARYYDKRKNCERAWKSLSKKCTGGNYASKMYR